MGDFINQWEYAPEVPQRLRHCFDHFGGGKGDNTEGITVFDDTIAVCPMIRRPCSTLDPNLMYFFLSLLAAVGLVCFIFSFSPQVDPYILPSERGKSRRGDL